MQALNASPTLHALHQDVQVADLRALHELERLEGLQLDPQQLGFKWLNATEILEAIETMLGIAEEKIGEVSDVVESAVESILEGIEGAALDAANKWNATVQEWVDKANAAGVDIQACLQEQQSLTDVIDGLRADAKDCVDSRINELRAALQKVKDLGPKGDAILEEAKTKVQACLDKNNPILTGMCLVATLPAVKVKAGGLMAEAVWESSVVATKAGAAVPLTALCTSKATAGRAAQASAIVDSTVSCIRSKLGQ